MKRSPCTSRRPECFVLRPETRLRHSLKLEGFISLRIQCVALDRMIQIAKPDTVWIDA